MSENPTLESRPVRRGRARPGNRPAAVGSPHADHPAEVQAGALRQTRRSHSTEIAEDYVEAIAVLTETTGEARAVDLAKRFGVTHVTVIRTISRLQRDGYVSSRPYRGVFLTDRGARLASAARERHALVVAFLRSLGIPERVVQVDAEGIEHHVSGETLAAFRRHLAATGDGAAQKRRRRS
jgi:DtxR family manganese transport transcriptional regulator